MLLGKWVPRRRCAAYKAFSQWVLSLRLWIMEFFGTGALGSDYDLGKGKEGGFGEKL